MTTPSVFIIVSGTRDAVRERHYGIIYNTLLVVSHQHQVYNNVMLVHGDAPGVDKLAAEASVALGWGEPIPVAADWDNCGPNCAPGHRRIRGVDWRGSEYCPDAGPRRNQAMVDRFGKATVETCIFPKQGPRHVSRGSWNMQEACVAAGLHYQVQPLDCGPIALW